MRQRAVVAYIAVVASAAVVSLAGLVALGESADDVNWFAFTLFAVLLFLSETQPRLWMRFGEGGEVTPGWSFAYALVLLGSPVGAVIAMVATNLYVDLRHQKGVLKVVFNSAQIALALSLGAIVLGAFGSHGSLADRHHVPVMVGLGIVAGGITVFTVSGLLTAGVISLHQGVGIQQVLRAGFALSMTADGALLALAPVFVITVEYSIIMLPLLGVTAYLVYFSARNALRQQHEATHDALTMLLNRRAFDQRVEGALESSPDTPMAVLVMDLDRFKDINDRLGHQIGDRLLVNFAQRLERAIPTGAIASRLGGDEFGVLVAGFEHDLALETQIRTLHDRLVEPYDLDGFPLSVAVSIGVAVADGPDETAESLMATADVAMYRAKRYETGVEYGGKAVDDGEHGRIGLLKDLSDAIGHSEIAAHYQPQVDLISGEVVGVEALIRWSHPTHGWVSPSEFIGVAEQTDLIGPITELMFRTAMTECAGLAPHIPRLAVNVAPRSLLDRQFAARILEIVDEVGFPADHLEIEITERGIVTGAERSALAIDQFRAAGVSISVDDFGTGYSSFQVLRTVRADRLKIDRQFTTRLDVSEADELIVTKVIELAHGLGLEVVAEGVESRAVWNQLVVSGCDLAQGFAIARPMPFDELRSWLSDHRRHEHDTTRAALPRNPLPVVSATA